MENTERLVRTWIATGKDEVIKQIVSEISADRMSLVDVVKGLGEYLTADEEDLRRKGVEFLSLILASLPEDKINKQSTRVLSTFYCGKLEDSGTIIPALEGILTLIRLQTCTALEVQNILRSMFLHVKPKTLVQSVRFVIFSILDSLVAKYRDVLKCMSKEFLDGYVGLADGEKDPRNLIIAFAIARVIFIEFDIHERIETLFNITFCYFPITFRPPPNDPYGITTEDLQDALRGCMSASPYFGPLAIPVFLEKLLAGTRATKRDTLRTIGACLPVYGSAVARVEARKLWNSLKLEESFFLILGIYLPTEIPQIFQPTDSLNEEEALQTTQILVKTIYGTDESSVDDADIQGLARDACEECIGILKEPEKSQARPAARILCAFMSTTPSVAKYTISQAIPHIVKLFHDPDEAGNRTPVLAVLTEFITAVRDSSSKFPPQPVRNKVGMETEPMMPILLPYKDEVLGVLLVGLRTFSSRRSALVGLQRMVTTENLLTDEELGFIVHNVNELLEADSKEFGSASDAVFDLLSAVAKVNPRPVEAQTLPLLFSSLPDVPPARHAITERIKILNILSALETLCIQAQLFETLVIRLTTKLDLICVPSVSSPTLASVTEVELHAAYAHWILTTLAKTLQKKVDTKDPDVAKYIERLVPGIFNLFVFSALAVTEDDGDEGKDGWRKRVSVATDPRLVKKAGEIVSLVIQVLPSGQQESYAKKLYDVLLQGDLNHIVEGHQKITADKKLSIFSDMAPASQKNLLILFSAAIIPLRKEVRPVVFEVNAFLDKVLWWSLTSTTTDSQRKAALHLLASILNKRVDVDGLETFANTLLSTFWEKEILDGSLIVERRRRAIEAWIWVLRALLIRSHSLALLFTDKLFGAFSDEVIGWDVARALGNVAAVDDVLTKQHHAVFKLLYAQKFVSRVLPRIIEYAKNFSELRRQTASLVALTSLIKSVPKATYQHELPGLIPLLLRGLELPDTNIRSNVIETFLVAAEGDSPESSLVASHASTLVALMLKNSSVAEMPSSKVRISALKYLCKIPSIVRYDILHSLKPIVIKELAKAIDDPKRVVRKEAVDARTAWFRYRGSA